MPQAQLIDSNAEVYTRFLPPHLQDRYQELLTDPELLHLAKQITLMDVRIQTLLENLDRQALSIQTIEDDMREELPHLSEDDIRIAAKVAMSYLPQDFIDHRTFQRFGRLIDKMEDAHLDGRIRDADRHKKMLFDGIRSGRRDGEVWVDIEKALEQRRKLVDTEQKRMANNQQTLPLDKVVMLVNITIEALKESVRKYVSDREIQQYILEDANATYRKLIGVRDHISSN